MTASKAPKNRTGYNAQGVQQAINGSRKPIGGREARMIHALLKGRTR